MIEEFQKLQKKIIEKLPKIHLSMESVDDYCYPDLEYLFEQFKEDLHDLDINRVYILFKKSRVQVPSSPP